MTVASNFISLHKNLLDDHDHKGDAGSNMNFFGAIDNTSHGCSVWFDDVVCGPCPDQPLWWQVLRWLKMMIFKMISFYHAKPIILIIWPLIAGMAIGYCIGYNYGQSSHKSSNQFKNIMVNSSRYTFGSILRYLEQNIIVGVFFGAIHNLLTIIRPIQSIETCTTTTTTTTTTKSKNMENKATKMKSCEKDDDLLTKKEDLMRKNLQSDNGTNRESNVPINDVPKHVAVIMDGNRRYGKMKYGNAAKGHWDGSSKLVEFAKWCIAEGVDVLTVYAFSTENWNRPPSEIAALMDIFCKYCDELRVEALQRNIKIKVLSTDTDKIPTRVKIGLKRMEDETALCNGGLSMNICLSYGGRGEITNAARSLAMDAVGGKINVRDIQEYHIQERLLTNHCGDPDVLIRTSGEIRFSNFLLWQAAYTELFFVAKPWPAIEKDDFLEVIRTFARGRRRRYGK